MDRRREILSFVDRTEPVIEIGPYFTPLLPKREGWNALSLDVFDAETLRQRAAVDPEIPAASIANIEEVDLLGPAHLIAEMVAGKGLTGRVGAIVSSHNLEHMPDLVGFLQGAAAVLKPGGMLSMAIPDKRACFDFFRPVTTLSALLAAHADRRPMPTPEQIFDNTADRAHFRMPGGEVMSGFWNLAVARQVTPARRLEEAHRAWLERRDEPPGERRYVDAHCWVFTPSSFALLINDLSFLGYHPFRIRRVVPTSGSEFYAHLENLAPGSAAWDRDAFYATRERLMRTAIEEAAPNGRRRPPPRMLASMTLHAIRSAVKRWQGRGAASRG